MSKEYKARIFKSGNSVALRLPKALGLKEGSEVVLREDQQKYSFEPIDTSKRGIDVDRFWGKAAGMTHVPAPREDFEPRPSSRKASR